eukprot:844264-Amphidinium_carterae.2
MEFGNRPPDLLMITRGVLVQIDQPLHTRWLAPHAPGGLNIFSLDVSSTYMHHVSAFIGGSAEVKEYPGTLRDDHSLRN